MGKILNRQRNDGRKVNDRKYKAEGNYQHVKPKWEEDRKSRKFVFHPKTEAQRNSLISFEENMVTVVRRDTREKVQVSINDVLEYVEKLFVDIQSSMYEKAKKRMEAKTFEAHSIKDIEDIMAKEPGFVKADWCGSTECELKLKEIRGTKSRCILEDHKLIDGKCVVCGSKAKHLVVWGIQY